MQVRALTLVRCLACRSLPGFEERSSGVGGPFHQLTITPSGDTGGPQAARSRGPRVVAADVYKGLLGRFRNLSAPGRRMGEGQKLEGTEAKLKRQEQESAQAASPHCCHRPISHQPRRRYKYMQVSSTTTSGIKLRLSIGAATRGDVAANKMLRPQSDTLKAREVDSRSCRALTSLMCSASAPGS